MRFVEIPLRRFQILFIRLYLSELKIRSSLVCAEPSSGLERFLCMPNVAQAGIRDTQVIRNFWIRCIALAYWFEK